MGEFDYIAENVEKPTGWHEALADRVTAFVGKPYFLLTHAVWFVLWVGVNTGIVFMARQFDAYPFSLLGILLSIEAIFLTGFVLISQNRQNAYTEQAARLDYEVNVRTYRELRATRTELREAMVRFAEWERRSEVSPAGETES